MREATRAFHCGGYSKVCIEHNRRDTKIVSREAHIDSNGYSCIIEEKDLVEEYDRLFTKAIEAHNVKTRADKQVYGKNGKDYLAKLIREYDAEQENNKQIRIHNATLPKSEWKKETHRCSSPLKEVIVGIYGYELTVEEQEKMCRDFLKRWKEKNPNCVVVGAYFHADEPGQPHLHIDYITVAYQNKRGPSVQVSENKCLKEMGYEQSERLYDSDKKRFDTPQIRFEDAGRALLDAVAKEYGIDIVRIENAEEKQTHKEKTDYILEQETKKIEEKVQEYITYDIATKERSEILQDKEEKIMELQGQIDNLTKDVIALEAKIKRVKKNIQKVIGRFEELAEIAITRTWNNIIKRNQANAAIKKGRRVETDLQKFLKDEDIEREFPIEKLGEMQVAKDKLEIKIEEDELIADDDFDR